MSDTTKKKQSGDFDASGGGDASEHEQETSGMRHAPRDKARAHERNEEARAEQTSKAQDPSAGHFRTTSYTEMDRRADQNSQEHRTARTPHEMSFHDELNRLPDAEDAGEDQEKEQV